MMNVCALTWLNKRLDIITSNLLANNLHNYHLMRCFCGKRSSKWNFGPTGASSQHLVAPDSVTLLQSRLDSLRKTLL